MWGWIFFINLPVGILATLMAWLFLPKNEENNSQSTKVDWWGIILLTVAVGSFQALLEEGEQEDWFSSSFIRTLAITATVGMALFIWRELTTRNPAVDLRVLRYRSLAAGSIYSGILGIGLYGTLFVVPIFAQSILHFSATQTGFLLAPGALFSAVMMILLGKISTKVDARLLIALGAIGSALVMFDLSTISAQTGTDQLFWPLVARGGVTVLMFLPLSLATLGGLPQQAISAGSGFYNLTRQLGGSVGIAALTSLLSQREAFHRAVLLTHLTPYDFVTNQRLQALTAMFQSQGMDGVTAQKQALASLSQIVDTQAAVLSFADIFRVVGVTFLFSVPLLFFLGKGGKGAKASAAH